MEMIMAYPPSMIDSNKQYQYDVVSGRDKDEFAKEVNYMLDNGWELYGNLAFQGLRYAQAVIRKKP